MKQQTAVLAALVVTLFAVRAQASDVDVSIRYFDKQIYHIQGTSGEPVFVQVTIANKSPVTYRFKLADDRAFSVDFDVRTMSNQPLEAAERLIQKRTQFQQVFFREITVESGESFAFVEDLRDYAQLNRSGAFIVQAKLYPELYRAGMTGANPDAVPLESNRLTLNIRPPALPGPGGIPLALDVETNAALVRESIPPDQVVEYMLNARQKGQWEKYFLYLDLESMLARNPVRQRQWLAESEEGRQRMIARYRTELQSLVVDTDITMIPMEFQIERTSYEAEEGT
ncbi:MAG: hypothetical protein LBP32_00585, partial [Spirochaetaceae bacterium]|nr:hypothetical protein [Spirochaetaceae bacterium]